MDVLENAVTEKNALVEAEAFPTHRARRQLYILA